MFTSGWIKFYVKDPSYVVKLQASCNHMLDDIKPYFRIDSKMVVYLCLPFETVQYYIYMSICLPANWWISTTIQYCSGLGKWVICWNLYSLVIWHVFSTASIFHLLVLQYSTVQEYVKWMTYWIVYSLVCLVEEVTDVFVSWLPFYYELKVEIHFEGSLKE